MYRRRTVSVALCIVVLVAACHAREPYPAPDRSASVARGDTADPTPLMGAVVINDTNLAVDHWGSDPYELARETLDIADDTLTLAVSYGGGCARHDLTLVADSLFLESNPVQLAVRLTHNANGDMCEAYLTETYGFDLTPIRSLYQQVYGKNQGTVRLRLRGPQPSGKSLDLIYTFQLSL